MKKYLFIIGFLCFSAALLAQEGETKKEEKKEVKKTNGPFMAFKSNTFDFGTMTQGDLVEHIFEFTNTGNAPLIITNTQASCGCTVPEWPRYAIAPGEKAEIKVAFNSTGKMGGQSKVVTIISNATNEDNRITFTANVVEKGKANPQ